MFIAVGVPESSHPLGRHLIDGAARTEPALSGLGADARTAEIDRRLGLER